MNGLTWVKNKESGQIKGVHPSKLDKFRSIGWEVTDTPEQPEAAPPPVVETPAVPAQPQFPVVHPVRMTQRKPENKEGAKFARELLAKHEDAERIFRSVSVAQKALNKVNAKELKWICQEIGVEFSPDATKAVLLILIEEKLGF